MISIYGCGATRRRRAQLKGLPRISGDLPARNYSTNLSAASRQRGQRQGQYTAGKER